MASQRRSVQYLPSWKLRQSIWVEKLAPKLEGKAFKVERSEDSFYEGIESLYKGGGVEFPDIKTISNWFKLKNYPRGEELDNLCKVSLLSRKWLKTDQWEHSLSDSPHESLHDLCNAIDYFICSVQPNIQPTLFKKNEQDTFSKRCLTKIGNHWNISSVNEDHGFSLRKTVQDVSLSKLKTHGSSAIPFYLSCVAVNEDISENECLDWYIDLLCSTLIISANLYRQNISFDFLDPDMPEYFGTCPNLLSAIGMFLLQPSSKAEGLFKDAESYGYFDEVQDCEILLKSIISGNMRLQEKFDNLGVSYGQVISTFHNYGITTIFLPEVRKDLININKNLLFIEPKNLENSDFVVFNLFPKTSTNAIRIDKIVNNLPPSAVFCKLKGDEPDRVSWGYGGHGVRNLAHTILYELFNNKRQKHGFDEYTPEESQIELVVYKLLSRLYSDFKYSLTSDQIIAALKEPLSEKDRKYNPNFIIPLEDYEFDIYVKECILDY